MALAASSQVEEMPGEISNTTEEHNNTKLHKEAAPRCSPKELSALKATVYRTRELLRRRNRNFDKQVWMEIAAQMHSFGFPARSWLSVKMRGKRILRDLAAGEQLFVHDREVTTTTPLHSSGPAGGVPLNEKAAASSVTQASDGETSGSDTRANCSVSDACRCPPPLIPSSEASAAVFMALRSTAGIPSTPSIYTSTTATGPQILHVCSRALPATSCSSSQALNTPHNMNGGCPSHVPAAAAVSTPAVSTPVSRLPTGADYIDLSASSDEIENHPPTTHPGGPPTTTSSPVTAQLQVPTSISSPVPMPDLISSISEQEFRKRMEIYRLKQEILQIKRAYWISKLKGLFVGVCSNAGR
ncbi:unnamed protein product [Calicophoron daubneyi]|uniref:Uncharacterized protein n=1 Tax=Calicophoron daubneyi TaxID=300641 RepID=A0AAV2T1N4_CALDB